jgi:hypothetical protein
MLNAVMLNDVKLNVMALFHNCQMIFVIYQNDKEHYLYLSFSLSLSLSLSLHLLTTQIFYWSLMLSVIMLSVMALFHNCHYFIILAFSYFLSLCIWGGEFNSGCQYHQTFLRRWSGFHVFWSNNKSPTDIWLAEPVSIRSNVRAAGVLDKLCGILSFNRPNANLPNASRSNANRPNDVNPMTKIQNQSRVTVPDELVRPDLLLLVKPGPCQVNHLSSAPPPR